MQNIDDDVDVFGIDFVKGKRRQTFQIKPFNISSSVNDVTANAKYNIQTLPTLAFFRKQQQSLIYEGDLTDEAAVLRWLTSNEVFDIKDEIEEVNRKMLEKILNENDFVAVYFCEANGSN